MMGRLATTTWRGMTSTGTRDAVAYQVRYTPKALKQIAKLDRQVADRIRMFFEERLDLHNPRSLGTRGRPK